MIYAWIRITSVAGPCSSRRMANKSRPVVGWLPGVDQRFYLDIYTPVITSHTGNMKDSGKSLVVCGYLDDD